MALQIERTPTSSYRSVIYINGWQFGRFNSRDGPQEIFPVSQSRDIRTSQQGVETDDLQLPEGILNHKGENELLFTLWSLGMRIVV